MTENPRQSALIRILEATRKVSAQTTFYAASLGAVALVVTNTDPATLPPALTTFAGGFGVNLLSNVIERLAQGDSMSEDDILDTV